MAAAVVAYALNPFDLIPDFVRVLGYLDDLILVPLGIALALKLVLESVMAEGRQRVQAAEGRPVSRVGATVMIVVWLAIAVWAALFVRDLLDG